MAIETPQVFDFAAIRLKLASPEQVRSWSHGEITRPETINYRTQKPEKDGLFCERIFGPSKDWECYCGKYRKIRYKGIICDKCGVEVTRALVRRERMGHIELATSVAHIWFLRGIPSKIGLMLDLSVQNLEKVIYFANFVITKVDENLKQECLNQLENEYRAKKKTLQQEFAQKINQIKSKQPADLEKQLLNCGEERERAMRSLDSQHITAVQELKDLRIGKLLSEFTYQDLSLKYGHLFEAEIGAEAIKQLLEQVSLKKLTSVLEEELKTTAGIKYGKVLRRLRLVRNFIKNKIRPEWMILTVLPVIPPDLRPMVPLDGGRYATADLNDLYRRVINRNNRLKRLMELNAPEIICRNEKRMLQEAVDALLDNSARHTKTTTASTGQRRQLKSLADVLRGKQGRFRQNLLGKRIDYSGRSVIVVGPELPLHSCGLPKKMALELFRPFVMSRLITDGYVHNVRSAARFIDSGEPVVWDILEDIVKERYVLLNRAPTLHRLGIQAFKPILIEGQAIQIPPLVCAAFNADFDGDQMAVYLPLTEIAQKEAENLMRADKNILKPASGHPIASPNRDIAWGCYYLTFVPAKKLEQQLPVYSSPAEVKLAYNFHKIGLQDLIKVHRRGWKLKGQKEDQWLETTAGRIIFNQVFPEEIPYFNEAVESKKLSEIVKLCLEHYDAEKTAQILNTISALGFRYATQSGYSWSMKDLPDLPNKGELLEKGNKMVEEIEAQYQEGLLTESERHARIIEVWTEIKDEIVKRCKAVLPKENPIATMIDAGARGGWQQLTQMFGMKGLVTNPAGDIIELPIRSSFREGFNVLEYFIATHGARKGTADTALRTAGAGYLTRRLIDVAHDVIIQEEDCGTKEGTEITITECEQLNTTLEHRVAGRFASQAVIDPKTKKEIVANGELINKEKIKKIEKAGITSVNVRSVLKCRAGRGLCQKCYGYDLGYNKTVDLGTAVGIIAAQSIGEPGTQLTMRTFHTGGVAGVDITQGLPRVEELLEIRPPKKRAIIADVAGVVKIRSSDELVEDVSGKLILRGAAGQKVIQILYEKLEEENYFFQEGKEKRKKGSSDKKNNVLVKTGQEAKEGDILFVNAAGEEIKARSGGAVKEITNSGVKLLQKAEKTRDYLVPAGLALWVKDGDLVVPGDQLTEGNLDLKQLYQFKGQEAVGKYLLKEMQYIYTSQGQKLNDKHFEIIIRQMFSRVLIEDPGDTELLPGDVEEKATVEEANAKLMKKEKPAVVKPMLLGISRVALSTSSFLSAASFQETSRILINAAITGKPDRLEGLKENVIIGRLIPVGTGFRKK